MSADNMTSAPMALLVGTRYDVLHPDIPSTRFARGTYLGESKGFALFEAGHGHVDRVPAACFVSGEVSVSVLTDPPGDWERAVPGDALILTLRLEDSAETFEAAALTTFEKIAGAQFTLVLPDGRMTRLQPHRDLADSAAILASRFVYRPGEPAA